MVYLESQVDQNYRPLCPEVAYDSLKVAQNYRPLAFYVDDRALRWIHLLDAPRCWSSRPLPGGSCGAIETRTWRSGVRITPPLKEVKGSIEGALGFLLGWYKAG